MGASISAYGLGRAFSEHKLAHVGLDMLRAQILTEGMVQSLKYTVQRPRPDTFLCPCRRHHERGDDLSGDPPWPLATRHTAQQRVSRRGVDGSGRCDPQGAKSSADVVNRPAWEDRPSTPIRNGTRGVRPFLLSARED